MNHNITSKNQIEKLIQNGVKVFWKNQANEIEMDRKGDLWIVSNLLGYFKTPMFNSKGILNGKWEDFFTI
jgi:hypothetical protein